MDGGNVGKKVRIILIGNFYYNGVILDEDETTVTIRDKFDKKVIIQKGRIETMEVSDG